MFRASKCPSSGKHYCIYATLVFVTLDGWRLVDQTPPIQSDKYQCRIGKGKGKGKAIPVQAWTGPEGSRDLRLTDFKTVGT